jgi:hypothetical protein
MAPHPQSKGDRPLETSDAERDAAARARDRLDQKLDEALEATFPASDAFALTVDQDLAKRASDAFADVDEDPNSRAGYASPPCFMHELDPSYLGLQPAREARRAGNTGPTGTDAE